MANLFYKDHLITVVGTARTKFLNFGFLWLTSSWETDGQGKSHTITGGLDWIRQSARCRKAHGRTRESMG